MALGFSARQYQGVKLNSSGDPVNYVRNPKGVSRENQSQLIDTITSLNRIQQNSMEDPEISTRISQYELAFRMQMSVPDLVDFSNEPKHVLDMYGTKGGDGSFAVELLAGPALGRARGSLHPFVSSRVGSPRRNQEGDDRKLRLCRSRLRGTGERPKRPRHAQRLADPLVRRVRRTPMSQGEERSLLGRVHHIKGFSMWMAGGGIKGGISYGSTDDLGYNAVENVVHVHDLHATMLHLLGIDHKKLTYRFQGRDFRLTDVHGRLVRDILA